MYRVIFLFFMGVAFVGCEETKQKVNESGEIMGRSATEFIGGISDGIQKSLECELILSESLKSKLSTGKYYIKSSSEEANNNKLVVYFIFDSDFNGKLTFKVKDRKEVELGRKQVLIAGKKGEAAYFDIEFDPRTIIENKSKIYID